jgi:hypothetical protein
MRSIKYVRLFHFEVDILYTQYNGKKIIVNYSSHPLSYHFDTF